MSLFGENKVSKDFIKPKNSIYEICPGSLFKRFASFLIDGFLVLIIALGVAYLLSCTSRYENIQTNLEEYYIQYGIEVYDEEEQRYSICTYVTNDDGLSDEEYQALLEQDACYKSYENFYNDEDAKEAMNDSLRYSLFMISLSTLIGSCVAYLVFPLIFKNGQSLGMKIVRLGLVTNKSIKVDFQHVFIRWSIGLFVIETMIPIILIANVFLFGNYISACLIFFLMIIITDIVCFLSSPHKQYIHDVISGTIVIDMNEQVIAKNLEEYEQNIER